MESSPYSLGQNERAISEMKERIKKCFKELQKEKEEEGFVVIPPKFFYFVSSDLLLNLILAVKDYCSELICLEKKHESLKAEAKVRGLNPPKVLPNEKERVVVQAKKVAFRYTLVLTKMDKFTNNQQEQNFFETLIYFMTRVLKTDFATEDFLRVEEETSTYAGW
eukprot:TRINITY_DN3875_c0_g1_i1.p1 TRINITY_DN3875_c0_g1~~TRINITY_DN3875_c0_g1_i1.p1  ORF type:complete len:165 (-),score=41.19 TRINITY_DN3875_c0_g1_i1:533-1027(-)